MRDVLFLEPKRRGTSLTIALDHLSRLLRRRAIVFLFSDFLDKEFEKAWRRTARRHDLIAVHLSDPCEEELPPVGLVELEDAETGQLVLVDTASRMVQDAFAEAARQRRETVRRVARSAGTDLIEVSTDGRHLDALVRFFRQREQRTRRS
jgi:uncharacterized protein (DUF58 family)